jgi:hypothetical protein
MSDGSSFALSDRMMPSASIAELRDGGTTLESDEAVAIVQQLISALRSRRGVDEGRPPYGPPSPESVVLSGDGSVSCRVCKTTPTLSDVGIFLHTLLPAGSPRVPVNLRYTIACAMLAIDEPSFDSLDGFSRDLTHHERGVRADAVRVLRARAGASSGLRQSPCARGRWRRSVSCLVAASALVAAGEHMRTGFRRSSPCRVPLVANPDRA